MSQHDSRRIAMQAIFLTSSEPDLTVEQVETRVTKSLDSKVIPAYACEIAAGVLAKKSETEADISKYLRKGWRLERVSQISVVVIEIATFEISRSDAASAPAAINEALILREESDDPRFRSFISGILTGFIPNK